MNSRLPPGTRLRLNTPTIAVVLNVNGTKGAHVLPVGSVIELLDRVTESNGLVNVRWTGQTCQMFSIDLRERGEAVNDTAQ